MPAAELKAAISALAPEVLEAIKNEAIAEKKSVLIVTIECMQRFWAIPVWVYVAMEVYLRLWQR